MILITISETRKQRIGMRDDDSYPHSIPSYYVLLLIIKGRHARRCREGLVVATPRGVATP